MRPPTTVVRHYQAVTSGLTMSNNYPALHWLKRTVALLLVVFSWHSRSYEENKAILLL